MITLIVGTPDSGKSKLAEQIIVDLGEEKTRIYIATMIPFGTQGDERVKKHQKLREGKNFITIEQPHSLDKIYKTISGYNNPVCLLECITNLVGNEMHRDEMAGIDSDCVSQKVVSQVLGLSKVSEELVVVTNMLEELPEYDSETIKYIELVNNVNEKLIKQADRVIQL